MKALSIRQPWAWLIVMGYKDIENRSRRTSFRGRFNVHASGTYSQEQHRRDVTFFRDVFGINIPRYEDLPRRAIVGDVELRACVREHESRWKEPDSWGYVLASPRARNEPIPLAGRLGFFEVHVESSHQVGPDAL